VDTLVEIVALVLVLEALESVLAKDTAMVLEYRLDLVSVAVSLALLEVTVVMVPPSLLYLHPPLEEFYLVLDFLFLYVDYQKVR
jgi:hypothetical protein